MLRKGQIITFPLLMASFFYSPVVHRQPNSHNGNARLLQETVFGQQWQNAGPP